MTNNKKILKKYFEPISKEQIKNRKEKMFGSRHPVTPKQIKVRRKVHNDRNYLKKQRFTY